jgi:hypothetical protein
VAPIGKNLIRIRDIDDKNVDINRDWKYRKTREARKVGEEIDKLASEYGIENIFHIDHHTETRGLTDYIFHERLISDEQKNFVNRVSEISRIKVKSAENHHNPFGSVINNLLTEYLTEIGVNSIGVETSGNLRNRISRKRMKKKAKVHSLIDYSAIRYIQNL